VEKKNNTSGYFQSTKTKHHQTTASREKLGDLLMAPMHHNSSDVSPQSKRGRQTTKIVNGDLDELEE
jgi:hypothetical protein